jgi:Astacin (Peptidase family M12A)/FG-GAP repeat
LLSNALIDDVRVYGRVLGPEEIAALQSGRAPDVAGCGCANAASVSGVAPAETPRVEAPPEQPTGLLPGGAETGAGAIELLPDSRPAVAAEGVRDTGELTAPQDLPSLPQTPAAASYSAPDTATSVPPVEVYRRDASGPVRSIDIVLPGSSVPDTILYEVIDGLAIAEGDIILGEADKLDEWRADVAPEIAGTSSSGTRTTRQPLNVVTNMAKLWPGGVIPYEVDANVPQTVRASVDQAAATLTTQTNLTVRSRAGEDHFVHVQMKTKPDGSCSSDIGRQAEGGQILLLETGCGVGSIMHEFLHAAGVWHEQSRKDRNQYVQIFMQNMPQNRQHNFQVELESQPVGPYDYGSIMHYGATAFSLPNCSGASCVTIAATRPLPPGVTMGQRSGLSAGDIRAINQLYLGQPGFAGGTDWGPNNYATAVAFGDVNGDGRAELAVGRIASDHNRFWVLADADTDNASIMFSDGDSWGADAYVTDIAFGDVDGDGRDELGVTRKAGSNHRYYIYDDSAHGFALLYSGGADWGGGNYATAIAFGDVDGDGRDEVAIGRKADQQGRYYLLDDAVAAEPFKLLAVGGSQWGAGNYTTALAFGDVNGDGRMELGVTRRASAGSRYYVLGWQGGGFVQLHAGGDDWGGGNYGLSIAFGNVDSDPGEEILVGRAASSSSRFYLIDDQSHGFGMLQTGGDLWGAGYYAVAVAIADVDGDGVGELAVARNAGEHGRYYVFDDALHGFRALPIYGAPWFAPVAATDIAAGDVDGDGDADLAVTRNEMMSGRLRYEVVVSRLP